MSDSAFGLPTGAAATRSALGLATGDTPEFAGIISGANGFDISPLSDIDADLLTVNVTGTPKLFWDESQDKFSFNKGVEFSATINPVSNDGAALGTSSLQFSDVFLAEGGVINWDNGDATLTQVANALTLAGAGFVLAAGDTSYAPLRFNQGGSLMTTPDAGTLEMDANCFYATTDAGNRGYVEVNHFIRANATRTFTSDTNQQAIFNSPANGRLTLETGTYVFEGLIAMTSMSATSGNGKFSLIGAGTATINDILWQAYGGDVTAEGTAAAIGGSWHVIATQTAVNVATAATGTGLCFLVKGTFTVTVAGTLIPSFAQTTAAAAIVSIGSYFKCNRVGTDSVVSVGQWD